MARQESVFCQSALSLRVEVLGWHSRGLRIDVVIQVQQQENFFLALPRTTIDVNLSVSMSSIQPVYSPRLANISSQGSCEMGGIWHLVHENVDEQRQKRLPCVVWLHRVMVGQLGPNMMSLDLELEG